MSAVAEKPAATEQQSGPGEPTPATDAGQQPQRTRKSGPRPYVVFRRLEQRDGGKILWEQITVRGPEMATTDKEAIRQATTDKPDEEKNGMFASIRQDEFKTRERGAKTETVETWS